MTTRTAALFLISLLLTSASAFGQVCARFGFARQAVTSTGVAQGSAVTTVDVNRDLRRDLVVAGRNGVHVILNAGAGKFSGTTPVASGEAVGVTWGDFNRDGLVDLAAAFTSAGDNLKSFEGDGRGGFTTGAVFTLSGGATAMASGDIDKDSDIDLVVAEATSRSLVVFKATPTGGFDESQRIALPGAGSVADVHLVDLNGDSTLDIVAADSGRKLASSLNSGGQFGTAILFDGAGSFQTVTSVSAGDVTFDGRVDLLGVSSFVPVLFPGRGDGTFLPREEFRLTPDPLEFFFLDVNTDGRDDLLIADRVAGVQLFLNDPNNSYLQRSLAPGLLNVPAVATRDFDRDGRNDILLLSADGTISVYRGECQTRFRPVKR
jgi:hypothetical protein